MLEVYMYVKALKSWPWQSLEFIYKQYYEQFKMMTL